MTDLPDSVAECEKQIKTQIGELAATFGEDVVCYPLVIADDQITAATVDKVFDDLLDTHSSGIESGCLVVVVDSPGGDIDAAYNLAMLFRRYGAERLTYVVPRWAKSAATLLVCGGDSVMMTPVAELGPLDPQITQSSPHEQRLEQFSPLHIESTLELIRNEFEQGNHELAQGLMQRLQFPLTLGAFVKSMDLGKQYAERLLSSRMLSDKLETARDVSNRLVEGYADHGFCINIDEARKLGLAVDEPSPDQLRIIWRLHKLARYRSELIAADQRRETEAQLEKLLPMILEGVPGTNPNPESPQGNDIQVPQ